MHAFLITGGTKESRINYIINKQAELKVSRFDAITLGPIEESIGIAQVRDFQRQLLLSPYNSLKKLGIIEEAQTMTVEAQNALLKTLEEPPPNTIVFLECPTPDALLPTIVSRCQLINLGTTASTADDKTLLSCFETLEQVANLPIGKRMSVVDEIAKTREDAKRWVSDAIVAMREAMLSQYTIQNTQYSMHNVDPARLLRSLLAAQAQLSANVTPKLVLDKVFLSV